MSTLKQIPQPPQRPRASGSDTKRGMCVYGKGPGDAGDLAVGRPLSSSYPQQSPSGPTESLSSNQRSSAYIWFSHSPSSLIFMLSQGVGTNSHLLWFFWFKNKKAAPWGARPPNQWTCVLSWYRLLPTFTPAQEALTASPPLTSTSFNTTTFLILLQLSILSFFQKTASSILVQVFSRTILPSAPLHSKISWDTLHSQHSAQPPGH